MSERDEEPFEDCYICHGDNGRGRRSDGSPICKHNSCIKEHRRRRQEATIDEHDERSSVAPAKAERTACFKIREILGVDMCVAASPRAKRAGCELSATNVAYKVRGGFGADKDDELLPDTRWVPMHELVANMDEPALAALDTWANKLQKTAKEARKKLRRERREE